jgi:uncharacterized membrane protein YdbT with pleckstrin-like domain
MNNYQKFHFKEVGSNENIIRILHRNWFDILQQFFIILVMILALAGGFFMLPLLFPGITQEKDAYNLFVFMENTFLLFLWVYSFFIWIDYYFDIWIITSERIINIEQKGLFMRSVSELKFERIQDVTVEVQGVIPTIINYGDVFVQTAGTTERFVFRHISNPYVIKDLIMSLQKKQEAEETNELGEMIEKKIHGNIT